MKIEMIKVQSSNIDAIGYSKGKKLLYVRFKGNSLYVYDMRKFKESAHVMFDDFLNAESKGSWLASIKDKVKFKKLR